MQIGFHNAIHCIILTKGIWIMKYFIRAVITVLILAVVLAGLVIKTVYDAGEFREISPHFNGQVKVIGDVLSSEDITIHPQLAIAFISSDDRRAHRRGPRPRPPSRG